MHCGFHYYSSYDDDISRQFLYRIFSTAATDLENLNTFDVTPTNQENQRPRFSILGTFDPIYQKKESADHGKSDRY